MKKPNQGTRKPTTHFEQVPVKILKKIIAAEETKTPKARPSNVIVERGSMKIEPYSMQFATGTTSYHRS
jgi:hypothetical protein